LTYDPPVSAPTGAALARSSEREISVVRPKRRNDLICVGVLLLAWLALWLPRLTGPINFRWDASAYYILGTALAEGKGYRLLSEPGEIEAVQYPPLLPALVAAHQRIMGTNDYFKVGSALRLTYCVLSGLFLLMAYALARKLLSPLYALFVGLITALSFYSFLEPSDVLYAEMPFAVAAIGFLLCVQKSERPIFVVASGLFGAAAYLLRTAGLALLLSWVAESLIRRRFRQAILRAVISAVPILFWQAHIWRVTNSYEYHHPTYSYQRADYYYPNVTYSENSRLVDPFRPELGHIQFRDLAGRLAGNVASIPVSLTESAVLPLGLVPSLLTQLHRYLHIPLSGGLRTLFSDAFYIAFFVAGLLVLIGAVLVATGRQWFLSLYFGITLAMIVLTPWQNQFWRYLAPVTPLTLMFVFAALMVIGQWLGRRKPMWQDGIKALGASAPAAAILVIQVVIVTHLFRNMAPITYYNAGGQERSLKLIAYGGEWHALDPAFEWVRRHAPSTAVIGTIVPHLAYLRTGHKAVLPPFETDPNIEHRLLDEVQVSFLVFDTFGKPGTTERYAAPVITQRPQNWRLVFTAPDGATRVYERTR
jgi:hypothetical protein